MIWLRNRRKIRYRIYSLRIYRVKSTPMGGWCQMKQAIPTPGHKSGSDPPSFFSVTWRRGDKGEQEARQQHPRPNRILPNASSSPRARWFAASAGHVSASSTATMLPRSYDSHQKKELAKYRGKRNLTAGTIPFNTLQCQAVKHVSRIKHNHVRLFLREHVK